MKVLECQSQKFTFSTIFIQSEGDYTELTWLL